MEVLYLLIPLSFFLALCGLASFFWAVCAGQLDDLQKPAEQILFDEAMKED